MTLKGLEALKTQENIKLDAAIAIRKLLDQAKADYKKAGGDVESWGDIESEILDHVTSDD